MSHPLDGLVALLIWGKDYDNDGYRAYTVRRPTWRRVLQAFDRLDGQTHSSFQLCTREERSQYPQLLIIGGPDGYAAILSCGDQEGNWADASFTYLNRDVASSPHATHVRGIGRGYTNWEIEEQHLTTDRALILDLIEYIVRTGDWPPHIPAER